MKGKGQLVTQYLESVSRELLEEDQKLVRGYVRNRHGIYVLYRRGKLYYVGLATNLRNRLQAHLRDRHGESWDRFSVYLTINNAHMKDLECLALRIMRPPGNKERAKFTRSENLKGRLLKDFREAQRLKRETLFDHKQRSLVKPRQARPPRDHDAGRIPTLAPYAIRSFRIRTRVKGKQVRARVLKDGSISLLGKRYNSPSLAAKAVFGNARNGWRNWLYERSPGDWVPLDTLRK